MHRHIKRQWLEALRSGEYVQGRGNLINKSGYCCLGVLVDLAVKAGVAEWDYTAGALSGATLDAPRVKVLGKSSESYGVLPSGVSQWAGLDNENPSVHCTLKIGGHAETRAFGLSAVNDGGKSFAEIADLIEEQVA